MAGDLALKDVHMTSRERVLAALDHRQPDRTPFAWGFGPTAEMETVLSQWLAQRSLDWPKFRQAVSDTIVCEPEYIGPPLKPGQPVYVGVWGIDTKTVSYGAGAYEEFVGHPLAGLENPAELDTIHWPNADWFDYGSLVRRRSQLDPEGLKALQIFCSSSGNPFEIYCWMTGMEEAMINLLTNPELVAAALDRICECFEKKLERCAEALNGGIDLVHFADDLGSQEGLLFSRDSYREVIQPFHQRLTAHARRILPSAKRMLHTDGAVFDILPDVINSGFDVLEAVQTDAAGMIPERLKEHYGNALSFHGGIPVQSLLPHGDVVTVRSECLRLCEALGCGGGYIAAPTHAIQAGTPPENIWTMLETVLGEETLREALQ